MLEALLENSGFTMNKQKNRKTEKNALCGNITAIFQGGAHVAPPKPPEIRLGEPGPKYDFT